MKRIGLTTAMLAVTLALVLAACGSANTVEETDTVVSTDSVDNDNLNPDTVVTCPLGVTTGTCVVGPKCTEECSFLDVPATECVDGVLVTYDEGQCYKGECFFPPTEETCPFGCNSNGTGCDDPCQLLHPVLVDIDWVTEKYGYPVFFHLAVRGTKCVVTMEGEDIGFHGELFGNELPLSYLDDEGEEYHLRQEGTYLVEEMISIKYDAHFTTRMVPVE